MSLSPDQTEALRAVYRDEQHKCPAGHILRRREWGHIGMDCIDRCAHCPVKKRIEKEGKK